MSGQGITSKAAIKIETSTNYGTEIAVNGSGEKNQLTFLSENISHAVEQGSSQSLTGNAGVKTLYPMVKKYSGDLLIEANYEGMEALFSIALGMSHQDISPINTSTDAYEHYIEPSEDLSVRAFNGYEMTTPSGSAIRKATLCFEKGTSIWQNASVMANGFTIEANPERVTVTFPSIPKAVTFDDASNNASTNWAIPGNQEQIVFDDMTLYIKARDLFTIAAANDTVIIYESSDITLDIDDGIYTGHQLAQAIANAATANGTLTGVYKGRYDEESRRFEFTGTVSFLIDGAGQMNFTLGFTSTDTAAGYSVKSPYAAAPDAPVAFASGDAIGVSSLGLSLENNLDVDSQDSESDLEILEPERNDFRRITGSLEIPRYKNDTFLDAVDGSTTYMMWIRFLGGAIDSQYKELNVFVPQIKFTNANAAIAGAELIKQSLSFEAQLPENYLDLKNFAFPNYFIRNLATATDNVNCFGAYKDGLYAGMSNGVIRKWDGTTWSQSTDIGAISWQSLQMFGNNLFAGGNAGEIYKYDGSGNAGWSASTDIGSGAIIDMVLFGDHIYALEGSTGKVWRGDGTSAGWTLSTDTITNPATKLMAYKGNLYMIGDVSATQTDIYKGDGTLLTGWATDTSIGSGWGTTGTLMVHDGKLYASIDDDLYWSDGSSSAAWTLLVSGIDCSDIGHMISYKGNLLLFTAASGDIFYYDIKGAESVNFDSSFNTAVDNKPLVYNNVLFMCSGGATVQYFKPIQDILVTIQNELSTNFL